MKRILLCLFGIAMLIGVVKFNKQMSTPSVTFNGKKFYLRNNNGNDQERVNEYLPEGQNFDNYTEMISVSFHGKMRAAPFEVAKVLGEKFKQEHPNERYLLGMDDETGDGVLIFPIITDKMIENNIFRTVEARGNIIILQHVYRATFPNDKKARGKMETAIGYNSRNVWMRALMKMSVPKIVQ